MSVCLIRDSLSTSKPGVLESVARACSPRVETHGDDVVVCDARGLTRVIGAPAVIAEEMRRMAWERGLGVRVAIAGSQTAAWLLAHVRPGATIVPSGDEARMLERLPLSALITLPDAQPLRKAKAGQSDLQSRAVAEALSICDRWGLVTLGDLARLPRAEVLTRMGPVGARLHQAACGEDATPMVPTGEAPRFVERMELEWPVEGLEPLSFVLARLCDALSVTLARADRGAVTITTRLRLVTKAMHERTLTLPSPMREAKTLRTLILLDLEAHPAPAGIDVVEVECGVTPGRIAQGSLLAYTVPTPEDLSTLLARLQALVGDSRVGAPVIVDTHNPRVSSMKPVVLMTPKPRSEPSEPEPTKPRTSIRRLRVPVPVKVQVERGRPVRVALSASAALSERSESKGSNGPKGPKTVTTAAGPWRTSGHWWTSDAQTWDRDEWDVALETGVIYRLARNRQTDAWELEGEID
jgi:protein ImuB